MRIPRFPASTGRRTATIVIVASAFMTAGVAGAAAGGTTFPGFGGHQPPATEPASTEPATSTAAVDAAAAAAAQGQLTVAMLPPATEPPAITAAPELPSTEPAATEPVPTEPPATQPPAPVRVEPAPRASKPGTAVAGGVTLECAVDHQSAKCHWSGGVVDLLGEFLLLRSDGRVVFMSGAAIVNSYIDADLAAGSYSYVVVTIDATGVAVRHSNRVSVTIGAAG